MSKNIAQNNKSKVVINVNVNTIKDQYRNSNYKVALRANQLEIIPELGILLEKESYQDQIHARIHLTEGMSGNALISSLLPQGELLQFEEVLPSMNDIFIQTVTDVTNQK